MADFEDEGSANLAPANGLQDDASGHQHPSLDHDPSQFSKLGGPADPYAQSYDPFASQPSSMMAHQDYDSMGHYPDDTDYPPANAPPSGDYSGDYGQLQDDHGDDLPANFAREAARNQNFTEPDTYGAGHEHPDMMATTGRGDEADEVGQAANGTNPFAMEAMNQEMAGGVGMGGTGGYMDTNDRPIMGYNPFLSEENQQGQQGEYDEEEEEEEEEEKDGGHFDHSQDMEFYKQQSLGGPTDTAGQSQDQMGRREDGEDVRHPAYERLQEDEEEDEDDADLQMEPVENIQQPPEDQVVPQKEEVVEHRPMDEEAEDDRLMAPTEDSAHPLASFTDEQTHSEDTCAGQPGDESNLTEPAEAEFDSRPAERDFDQPDEVKDQTSHYQEPEHPTDVAQSGDIDFGKGEVYEEEQRAEEEENVPPQPKAPGEEEELGIVNQGFSDDVDMEGGKGIPEEEEEFVQKEAPAVETAPGMPSTDDFMEQKGGEEEKEEEEDEEIEREQPIGREDEKREEIEEEKMEEQERPLDESEKTHDVGTDETGQPEQIDTTKGDYSQEQLRSEADDEEEITQKYEEKGLESRLPDSDFLSSEHEDRSFVDNLSELASPDTIPQPLPSPPEPKDMSPFDPLAPTNSVSPCHEAGANVGQHGELFEPGNGADETNNTGDFLTAGEVEGETKFGVDGTAITQTATQNNAFLHSDDEEDEEEEDESQPLDQGGLGGTAGTTETETSVDERSGEYGGQGFETMENNDNALMSMSMEGSFYDDGGELIGGEDRREEENHVYQGGSIVEEDYRQHAGFEQRPQDSYLMNQDSGFGQQIQNDFAPDAHEQDNLASDQDAFDPLRNATAPPAPAVNGVSEEGGNMGGLDSLLDAPVTDQGLQTPVTEKDGTTESSVDSAGIDSIVHDVESSVDSQPLEHHADFEHKDLEDAMGSVQTSEPTSEPVSEPVSEPISEPIPEPVSDKPEEPSSSVDEPPAPVIKEEPAPAPEAAAVPDASVAAAAAAAAAVPAAAAAAAKSTTTTTTTVKKSSSAKAGGKTTTTSTTTKVTKETKAAAGSRAATTKKETTTTTTRTTSPRKPTTDSRPTSAATEKKTPAKTTTSPTKSAGAPASAKSTGPLPSYAQPVTPRKPREAKVPTTDEKKKMTATPRLPSAGTRTPRPQSATTTTTSSTTKSATTRITASSRTEQLARPKSSPTKLTNGTAPTDTKSTPKKYGIDSRNEGYKPGGGHVKITTEKKEFKATSRIDAGSKGATPGAKPAAAKTSPRTSSAPKTGEAKSKIGSLDNATHSPGGGNVKITHKKPDYASVGSRIGSKDKADHKPGGGNVKIENRKLKVEAKSKIGSLDNAAHKPAGGDKKIESKKLDWKVESRIGSLDNAKHVAGGGDKKIEVQKTDWKAQSKVGSLDNAKHKPGGGEKQIESHKLDFKDKASPKIGSLDKSRSDSGSDQGATEVPAANGATSDN